MCKHCQAATFANPNTCAFSSEGRFNPKNDRCQTMAALLDVGETTYLPDGSVLCVVNVYEPVKYAIMLTYNKDYTHIIEALVIQEGVLHRLTLTDAYQALQYHGFRVVK